MSDRSEHPVDQLYFALDRFEGEPTLPNATEARRAISDFVTALTPRVHAVAATLRQLSPAIAAAAPDTG